MKRLLATTAFLLFGFVFVPAQETPPKGVPRLTNKEVVQMVKAGISSDELISKIKTSRCDFDTDPSMLAELKRSGVPNDALKAMVEAPYGLPIAERRPEEPAPEPKDAPHENRRSRSAGADRDRVRYEATWDSPEFGDISEIKDLTKVYVYSGDIKARQMILDELREYPRLLVVGSVEDADFIINYAYQYTRTGSGYGRREKTVNQGDLMVSVAGRVDEERGLIHQRIVWSTQKSRSTTLTKDPARKTTEAFIKDFKTARGEG